MTGPSLLRRDMETRYMRRPPSLFGLLTCITLLATLDVPLAAQSGAKNGEWRSHAGEPGSTKYSPLSQINRDNVKDMKVLWTRPTVDPSLTAQFPGVAIPPGLRSTPLMVDGVMYVSDAFGLIEALDAATGKTLWVQEPLEQTEAWLRAASSQRGQGYWQGRIFTVRGEYLYALDAKTGKAVPGFGENGAVLLRENASERMKQYFYYSAPLVTRDVVIVGQRICDACATKKQDTPGDVFAYDVRTGALRWTFHSIPREGEFGTDTWENESWRYSGAANMWGFASADEELGYVYLPLSTPTNDWYGGHRLGNDLFAETLVCVDAATGKRIWHFQVTHHGVWDYDLQAAPILANITVGGKEIKAVILLTKQAMAFVFDRVTGEPVWPIEERPVPQSNVPGERLSPTQPFPTKPAPYDRQGISVDDLIDFTPELHAEALDIAKQYVLGPLYTPPTIAGTAPGETKGTITVPGWMGGSNWNGGALDPETGVLYVPSWTAPDAYRLREASPEESDMNYLGTRGYVRGPQGLPLLKPPYGRITAINMNTGEQLWMVPNGEGPRNHPLLQPLKLPPLGNPGRPHPLLTKTLLFIGEGSGEGTMSSSPPGTEGNMFRAYDKVSGTVLWEIRLSGSTSVGAPMTYSVNGKQYIVIPVGGRGNNAGELVALGLEDSTLTTRASQ